PPDERAARRRGHDAVPRNFFCEPVSEGPRATSARPVPGYVQQTDQPRGVQARVSRRVLCGRGEEHGPRWFMYFAVLPLTVTRSRLSLRATPRCASDMVAGAPRGAATGRARRRRARTRVRGLRLCAGAPDSLHSPIKDTAATVERRPPREDGMTASSASARGLSRRKFMAGGAGGGGGPASGIAAPPLPAHDPAPPPPRQPHSFPPPLA